MKKIIVYLLLATLISIVVFPSFAQQNQNTLQQEIESLKKQLSEIQSKLQTVENVEKMELAAKLAEAQAKLAEANTKLINADFGKFERELRNSNEKWLWGWTGFFATIVAIVVAVIGLALWFSIRSLIADRVEESLNGFRKAVDEANKIKNQLLILEEGHAHTVLHSFHESYFRLQNLDFKEIRALREETLLRILDDNTIPLAIRYRAVAVLASRNSPRLVSPTLKLLNLMVDSDLDSDQDIESQLETELFMQHLVNYIGKIHTQESYEGLKKFLFSLITDNPKNRDLFLTLTTFLLSEVGLKLDVGDSVSVLRLAIPHLQLQVEQSDLQALKNLIRYFDVFNAPEGIKEILTYYAAAKTGLEDKCLELLQKHDPDFVKNWKAQKETTNTKNEESS